MNESATEGPGTDAWGIDHRWLDVTGRWHDVPERTIHALRDAMGSPDEPPTSPPVWVVRPGDPAALHDPCALVLEDGSDLGLHTALPPDLPLGIHRLLPASGGPETTLVVSPGTCSPAPRTWGVTVQVPTARSAASWGIGDLADTARVARWVVGHGGGALALSPLHAPAPGDRPTDSPYYPASRRWRSPLLVRIDHVPGAGGDPEVIAHGTAARALLGDPVVDRPAVWHHQRAALEHLWAAQHAQRRPEVDDRLARDPDLAAWGRYCALSERHGANWRTWPAELRHPDGPAVAAATAAAGVADRVAFHAWLQVLVEAQIDTVARELAVIQDLAIGVDPGGADAWLLQDLLALDARVGAPPDELGPEGQDWGLPPFRPASLRAAGYRPLAALFRAVLAPGGGVRIDHVMGLSRLFWIPAGGSPADGAYVRFPDRELLEVLAMESARAGAFVVGEDLGTVEPGFREELARTGVLSTRVVWFEDRPPEQWPQQAAAMVTTHDLPTLAGAWTGTDEDELAELHRADPEGAEHRRRRLAELSGLDTGADPHDVAVAVHERLGRSAATLALATLEDVTGARRRPNVPGTTTERPNWSLALPMTVEELDSAPTVAAVVDALDRGRRAATD